ncbi:glycosyl transferase family 1 [Dissulfurispira thermophila]|uniref:Glycosyl transferase family 1 n=1 Tax=Dissulfurispira thermophila TaxID=2715679 RepID=A0A7G1H173_9BACT|nr:glycosyltransferase [Dissulfurispira thermophila]BCB95437.1 glycosyl transferase family 1 [Dissulfurispira thermophila]
MITQYSGISPKGDLILLHKLGEKLNNRSFLHINSTRAGGGVAEILHRMIPLLKDIGIDARWEVIEGDERFFDITKKIHNSIQGNFENITEDMWHYHYEVNRINAERLNLDADAILIHDPQPAPLIEFRKSGIWIWRCHIDFSNPIKESCDHLLRYCQKYDAAIFSVAKFARAVGIDEFIIPPSIDPLSEKNIELTNEEIIQTLHKFQIPHDRPIILQISRFDRFKDPIGVIKAYRLVKKYNDSILILAGSPATDDPEGEIVIKEVQDYASDDPDIYILLLPPFSDREINALQRAATVVLQKSLKEGFGLTVSEAMWKGKPVIGGATGGIPLQIVHGVTGFLVHSVEGAAFRIRQFLNNLEMTKRMGEKAREHVRNNFLITRQIRDYLSVWYAMENKGRSILEL